MDGSRPNGALRITTAALVTTDSRPQAESNSPWSVSSSSGSSLRFKECSRMPEVFMHLLRRLRSLFRLSRLDSEIAEELEFHRAMKERELQNAGLSQEAA